jgi:hypothetical protein
MERKKTESYNQSNIQPIFPKMISAQNEKYRCLEALPRDSQRLLRSFAKSQSYNGNSVVAQRVP